MSRFLPDLFFTPQKQIVFKLGIRTPRIAQPREIRAHGTAHEHILLPCHRQLTICKQPQSYKHENEVRLIINRTSNNLDDVKVISGKMPKLCIYNDRQRYIDEIMLGAKLENPEDYVLFIYKQGNKIWSGNKEPNIKATNSVIQYR